MAKDILHARKVVKNNGNDKRDRRGGDGGYAEYLGKQHHDSVIDNEAITPTTPNFMICAIRFLMGCSKLCDKNGSVMLGELMLFRAGDGWQSSIYIKQHAACSTTVDLLNRFLQNIAVLPCFAYLTAFAVCKGFNRVNKGQARKEPRIERACQRHLYSQAACKQGF